MLIRRRIKDEGTLNLNESTIIIYYAKKSIKNTPRGCYSLNDSLFVKYAEKGLEKMCSTVNEQLRLCRESYVGRTVLMTDRPFTLTKSLYGRKELHTEGQDKV